MQQAERCSTVGSRVHVQAVSLQALPLSRQLPCLPVAFWCVSADARASPATKELSHACWCVRAHASPTGLWMRMLHLSVDRAQGLRV